MIPPQLTKAQTAIIYASEADVLNMALFGKTAAQWRKESADAKGDIRDQANSAQLVCLANLENLNALFIAEGYSQEERLQRLNQISIQQLQILMHGARLPHVEVVKTK